MLHQDELFVGKGVEYLENNNELGVIIKVNNKSIKVAFGNRIVNEDKDTFTHASSKRITDIEVIPTETIEAGSFGYVRLNSDDEFTKENLEAKKIVSALITNITKAHTKIALFENENQGSATKIVTLEPELVDKFFTTTL